MLIVMMDINSGACRKFKYGECKSKNDTCSECYLNLKKSLLKQDQNIQNLSKAFFPPKDNIPEFVIVTYCFSENCTLNRTWFWTHDSSYLFFPIKTFQYLTLFFGKPAEFFSRTVTVRLDEDCYFATNETFELLTQRVSDIV